MTCVVTRKCLEIFVLLLLKNVYELIYLCGEFLYYKQIVYNVISVEFNWQISLSYAVKY